MITGRRPLSDRSREKIEAFDQEQRMRDAEDHYFCDLERLVPKKPNVTLIAIEYEVKETTLGHRISGQRSQAQYAQEKKLMLPAEETVLVSHIQALGRRAIPMTPRMIEERARQILETRKGVGFKVGKGWRTDFLGDHPELQLYRSTKLEMA